MADPLSVTGSVVGIVSLGLSVCQGLISYYGPWRAYDQEIGELAQKAEGLKATLRIVQGTLQRFEATWTLQANDVQSNVNSCREVLQKLEKAIEKYRKTEPPYDFGDKLQGTGKRALYPFRQKTLIWLKNNLEGLQVNLNTTLQVLQLTVIAHQKEQTDQLISTSQNTAAVVNRISETMYKLDTGLSFVQTTVAKLRTESSRDGIGGPEWQSQYMNPPMVRLQQELINGPPIFRVFYDAQSQVPNETQWHLQRPGSGDVGYKFRLRTLCSCSRLLYTKGKSFRLCRASIFQLCATSHNDGCPFSNIADRIKTVGINYTVNSYLLGVSFQAKISIAIGTRTISISPRLSLRNIVPTHSPAFKILNDLNESILDANTGPLEQSISDVLDETLRQLCRLFDARRASPTDITPDGETLLHYTSRIFRRLTSFDENTVQNCRQFLRSMLKMCGNVNEAEIWGTTPLDALVFRTDYKSESRFKNVAAICSDFIDGGAAISERAIGYYSLSVDSYKLLQILGRHDNGYSAAFDMSEIAVAIFTRSEKLLEIAVSKYPASVNTRYDNHLTPLHLAAGWPYGLAVLLRAGAKVEGQGSQRQLPIHYACLFGCLPSVLLLIEAGSALPLYFFGVSMNILDYAIQSREQAIVRTIITALARRRQQLWSLAEAELPLWVLKELNLPHDRLLDVRALEIWRKLFDYGIPVDESLNPGYRSSSVYHTRNLNPRIAAELFDNGFRDVDSIDWTGQTPLMQLGWGFNYSQVGLNESLALGNWLISKGADMYRNVDNISVGHAIGRDLGGYLEDRLWTRRKYIPTSKDCFGSISDGLFSGLDVQSCDLLHNIFASTKADNCICACSSHGCRPLSMMLKALENSVEYIWRRTLGMSEQEIRLFFLTGFIKCMESHWTAGSTIPSSIIRFATFTELELTHTCCDISENNKKVLPLDEAEEIRFEQRYIIDDLDSLVTHFETQYKKLGLSLHIFLQEYWSTKMEEFLTHESVLDEEVVKGARELGIILELS